jgi:hypothetical protein
VDDINRVITRLGINQPTPSYMLYTLCMCGIAKSTFGLAVHTYCNTACHTDYKAATNDAQCTEVHSFNDSHYHMHPIIHDSLNHMITMLMPDHIGICVANVASQPT